MIFDYLITPDASLEEAMIALTNVKGLGLIVVDEKKLLLGSLTDGDIRRYLSQSGELSTTVEKIYHRGAISVTKGTPISELEKMTEDKKIKIVPICDDGVVVDVFTISGEDTKTASVVIMAGGLGSRLGDHTKDTPKPMLEVAGKPVLERIIKNFTDVGFEKFYISVNYKAEIIEEYFKDGRDFNCSITYLKENKRLGTAGSLSLLPDDVAGPIVITNGDLLTLVDFRRLLSFHKQHNSPITMCTRKYEIQVPFGVVNIKNGSAESIDEKPIQSFDVSAGVYVINKELLKDIPKDQFYDMPTLIDDLLKKNIKASCFPMIEQWIDIGQISDLKYAREVYKDQND